MNSSGAQVLGAMQQVRGLFRELSQMLLSADYLMGQAGWKPAFGTTTISEATYNVNRPNLWLPNFVFRIYDTNTHPELWGAIVVALSNELPEPPKALITEPLVHGLLLEYESKDKVPARLDAATYKLLFLHEAISGRTHDGQVTTMPWVSNDTCQAVKVSTWTVPMVEVTDSEVLKTRVIQGFVAAVQEK